jgi:uncharacterized repeat protein (TIGR01451 family)
MRYIGKWLICMTFSSVDFLKRELLANYLSDNFNTAFDAVGKTSLGGVAISEDESRLYVMSLENRTLYALNTTTGTVLASQAVPATLPLIAPSPVTTCNPLDVRPFALAFNRGVLYAGLVCSAESTATLDTFVDGSNGQPLNGQFDVGETFVDNDGNGLYNIGDTRQLQAYVYTVDPITLAFSASPVFQMSLRYPRGAGNGSPGEFADWRPWTPVFRKLNPTHTIPVYPQPMLTGITFDSGGNLILGIRDRYGDQMGNATPSDPATPATLYLGATAGETLRACVAGSGWTLESNGRCGGTGTAPQNTGQGPGNGEFYFQDDFSVPPNSGDFHDEVSLGTVLQIPGFPTVISTVFDPISRTLGNNTEINDGGFRWYNNTSGASIKDYRVYNGSGNDGTTFGKSSGLGGLAALCSPPPIELGNRVWMDTNNNGIQDPGETPLANVTVNLYVTNGGTPTLLATALTDANGQYIFSNDPRGYPATGNNDPTATSGGTVGGGFVGNGQGGRVSTSSQKYGILGIQRGLTYEIRLDNPTNYTTGNPLFAKNLTETEDASPTPGGSELNDSDASLVTNPVGSPAGVFPVITYTIPGTEFGDNTHVLDFGFSLASDLGITKSVLPTTYVQGASTNVVYTVVVTNNGPSDVTGAPVLDPAPANVTFNSWTCVAAGGTGTVTNACGAAAGVGSISTTATLRVGATATFTINATVGAGASGIITNTASETLPATIVQSPTNAPDIASADLTPVSVADLGVTKVVTPSTYVQGASTNITYTVVVTNNGPSDVTNATVTDTAPANVTFNSWTCAAAGGTGIVTNACGAAAGVGNIATNVTLRSGATATFTIDATVGPAASGTITNTVTEALPPGVTQGPTNAPDTASADVTPTSTADLGITKSVVPLVYVTGSATNVTYTVVVTNNGPSDVTAATVTDAAPANVTFNSWTCAATGGTGVVTNACGAAAGVGNIATTVTLRNGATATFTIDATVGPAASGTITNTASETLPPGVTQGPTNAPDIATAAVTGQTYALGNRVWRDLNNSGTIDAADGATPGIDGVVVRLLNAGTLTPATDAGGNPVADQTTAGGGYYRFDNLAAGDYVVEIVAANFTGAGVLAATISSSPDAGDPDTDVDDSDDNGVGTTPDPTNGIRSAAVTLGPGLNTEPVNEADLSGTDPVEPNGMTNLTVDFGFTPVADLGIVKSVTPQIYTLGAATNVTYTFVVTNNGPSDVTNANVADVAPAGVTFNSWTCLAAGGTGTVTNACGAAAGVGNIATTVTLRNGATATFTINAIIGPAASGTITNTASETLPADVVQGTPNAPDTASADVTPVSVADLGITKSANPLTYTQGGSTNITYTVVVTNNGPSDVTAANVTDAAPANVTFNSWTCAAAGGTGLVTNACGAAAGTGNIATTVTLRNGATATFTINATVGAAASGPITNTASETLPPGVTQGPTNAPDTASVDVTPTATADLGITKSVIPLVYASGTATNVTYTVVVTNNGPSDVTAANVADAAPANVTFNNWTCVAAGGTGTVTNACGAAAGTGNIATTVTLRNGATATFTIDATIGPAASGTVTNTATETLPPGVTQGPTNAPDTASAVVTGQTYALGNRVWRDLNNSGTIDAADGATPGIDGVVVRLLNAGTLTPATDAGGNPVADQTTANGGYYRFDNLPAGDYVVEIVAANFTGAGVLTATQSSSADAGDPDTDVDDSDDNGVGTTPDPTNGIRSAAVTLGPGLNSEPVNEADLSGTDPAEPNGQTNLTVDFGFTPVADLGIVKSVTPQIYTLGAATNVTYTFIVTNNGPSDVTNANVADVAPAGVTFNSWTCAAAGGTGTVTNACGAAAGVGNIATTVTLRNGATATFTILATIGPAASGTITNTASETLPADVVQGTPNAPDSASADVTPVLVVDLGITKTVSPQNYVQGGVTNVIYTAVVTNNGPADVTAANVIDTAPANVTFSSWTCTAAGGIGVVTNACGAAAGTGNIATTVTLRNGATATFTINAIIGAGATGTVTNTASETLPAGATQGPTNSPDTASADVTPLTFSLGNRVWYDLDNSGTINNAESGADGVVVRLLRSDGVTPATDASGNPVADQTTAGGGYYRFDNLPAGDYIVEIVAANFAGGGPLAGYVGSRVEVADPNTDIDSDDNGVGELPNPTTGVRSGVVTLGPGLNSEPTNDNDPATNPLPGESLNSMSNRTVDFGFYRLILSGQVWNDANNNGLLDGGESPLPGLAVELLNPGGTVIQTTTTQANGGYQFSGIPEGDYSVRVTPPPGYTSSTGGAGPIGPYEPGPDPDNDIDNDDNGSNGAGPTPRFVSPLITLESGAEPSIDIPTGTAVNDRLDFGAVPIADLAIAKSHTTPLIFVGGVVDYILRVTNVGAAPTSGVIAVTDNLPAGLNYVSGTGTGWTCGAVGQLVTCSNAGPLAPSAVSEIILRVGVSDGVQPSFVNTATVSVPNDLNPTNNTASDPTIVGNGIGAPGGIIPGTTPVEGQKPGSVLIFPVYSSDALDPNRENTRISLTNVDPYNAVCMHLFFIDGSTCSVADSIICLTPNQTSSFLLSDFDPGVTGYLVGVAVDESGCPISFNRVLGESYVKMANGASASLPADSYSALYNGKLPGCDANSTTATIDLDGVQYNMAGKTLAASNVMSMADGNTQVLALARTGGDLTSSAAALGSLFGVFYNDTEIGVSFTLNASSCQFRQTLSNSVPRTTPRLSNFIEAGRTGWFKVSMTGGGGMTGAIFNINPNTSTSESAFKGGHPLHKLTLTPDRFIIPVYPTGR